MAFAWKCFVVNESREISIITVQMLLFIYLPEHFLFSISDILWFIWIYMIVLGWKLMFKPWPKMWPLVNIIHSFFFFSSPESTCGVQMCVHCQSDGYKSASRSEQASRGSRCSYVGLFFPWEPHRSCNQGCVLYWTGKHAARSGSGPKQHTTSIRSVPPAVCGSARLESWKAACFLASVGFSSFVRCHRYGRAKLFCSVWL